MTASHHTPRAASRRRPSYQPALDGLRAVAVVLVVAFHAGFDWMPAGYLGVSVFFTLSGFLITRLLLAEYARNGRVAYGDFFGRRVRRLLPASTLCLLLVMVATAFGAFRGVEQLSTDLIGASLQVFNWVSLAGDASYGELFVGGVSPLEHFWSLAIEEQFYWLWPAVFAALAGWSRRHRRPTALPVAAMTMVFVVAAPVIAAVWGADAAYWATPARLGEILVGALLACLVARRGVPARARHAALPALVVIVALSATLPSGSGPAYAGALPLFAVLTATLLWSLQVPGPVRRVLSTRPLVGLGKISYGIYLFHWPVDVLLRERGWRLDSPGGFAVASAITLAIALASFWLVERPVRHATWEPSFSFSMGAAVTVVAMLFALVLPTATPVSAVDQTLLDAVAIEPVGGSLAPLQTAPAQVASSSTSPTPSSSTPTISDPGPLQIDLPPAPSRPLRILFVGDSTAGDMAEGMAVWSADHPQHARVGAVWAPGLTFLLEPEIVNDHIDGALETSRTQLIDRLPTVVEELRPDLVVLLVTLYDSWDRRWSAEEGPLSPADPRFAQRMLEAYTGITRQLLDAGVPEVSWVLPATPGPPAAPWQDEALNDPTRFPVQRDVISELVAGLGPQVSSVDLHGWLSATGHDLDIAWRPDGVHFSTAAAAEMTESWLGPLLVRTGLGA